MKWNKFKGLVQRYPWLIEQIDMWQILEPTSSTGAYADHLQCLDLLYGVVRRDVEYITFRPWKVMELGLESPRGHYQVQTSLEHALRCDPYYGGHDGAWYDQEWIVFTRNDAGIISGWAVKDEQSILQTIQEIQNRLDDGRCGGLTFEAVMCRATEGDYGGPFCNERRLKSLSLTLYPFPKGYRPPQPVIKSPDLNSMRFAFQAIGL